MVISSKEIFSSQEGDLRIHYGEYSTEQPLNFQSHNHLICELLYILEGDVCHHIEGRSYKLRKYDLVFVRPGKNHYLEGSVGSAPYRRFNIMCHHSHFPEALYASLPQDADVINFEDNDTVRGIFERLQFYSESIDKLSQEKLFSSLMCEIFCHFAIAAKNPENRLLSSSNPTLEAAIDYIDANLSEINDIEQVCGALFITKSYLHHIFKTNMRITPKKYINQKRLLLAQRMMRRGGPTEVFRECGFADYTTFYRNYKAYFGYEPKREGEKDVQPTVGMEF